jgi:hypothetical protein
MSFLKEHRTDRSYYHFLVVLFSALLGALCWANAEYILSACVKGGDYLLIALEVERARDFESLYGAYSRTGVRHPLPVYFYLYALGRAIFSPLLSPYPSYIVTQLILNLLMLGVACVFLPRRFRHSSGAVLLVLVCCYLFRKEGRDILFNLWGPATVIAPMLCFIVTASALAAGRSVALPFCLFAGMLTVGNHFGTVPVVFVLFIVAAVASLRTGSRPGRLALFFSSLILLSAVTPPLLELWHYGSQSSPAELVRFALKAPAKLSLGGSIAYTGKFYSMPFRSFAALPSSGVLFGLIIILAAARSGEKEELALDALLLLAILLSVLSAMKIDNPRYHFLMWWQHALVALSLWLVVMKMYSALFHRFSGRKGKGAAKNGAGFVLECCGVVLCLMYASHIFQREPIVCRSEGKEVVRALPLKVEKPYGLSLHDVKLWKAGAGIALALKEAGYTFCVQQQKGIFGRGLTCKANQQYQRIHLLPSSRIGEATASRVLFKNKKIFVIMDGVQ